MAISLFWHILVDNSADKLKITKMTAGASDMFGFHFKKKENDCQLEPDRISYSYVMGKLNIYRSKIDICVKFWLPR